MKRFKLMALTGALLALLCSIGLAKTVSAAEVGPYNPPPPVYKSGPCNPMAAGRFNTHLSTPQAEVRSGPSAKGSVPSVVWGNGDIITGGNTSCSHAQVQFYLDTKACGTWGCHWQTRSHSDWRLLPVSGTINSGRLEMDCRKGSNSYRLRARISWIEADSEDSPLGNVIPYLVTKIDEKTSDVVKLTC